ncbi:protein Wnt-4-like [Taeniopygia guttata]|uniref:protein Wnt-4-like n=1 Tax=Taeniopygia guttata TaxID=59729 RepID=UPI003BB90484
MELVWLYLMLIHVQHVAAMTWLSLAKQASLQAVLWDPRGCDGLMGLEEEQIPICWQQVEDMEGLQVFAKATIQDQCHFLSRCRHTESAVTHAISGAGSTLAASPACSQGGLHKCGHHRKGWAATPQAPQALLAHMEEECKCHGVWGSCEAHTWKVMAPFCHMGTVLKEKSEGTAEVYPKWLPRSSRSRSKHDSAHGLVYLRASPDFCDRDPRHGIFRTSGRQCKQTLLPWSCCAGQGIQHGPGRAGRALQLQVPLHGCR